jgi:hypothetical protein
LSDALNPSNWISLAGWASVLLVLIQLKLGERHIGTILSLLLSCRI